MAPIALACAGLAAAHDPPVVLPSSFDADRVFVVPQTVDGKTLTLYTDTGGGLFITEPAARRAGLAIETEPVAAGAGASARPRQRVVLPKFKAGFSIPAPLGSNGRVAMMPVDLAEKNAFVEDGMLGAAWFGGRIWTWDYPNRRLLLEDVSWKPDPKATRVALGLPRPDADHAFDFARIAIGVDGKSIDVLLDTGATTTLGDEARTQFDDGLPAVRATSFIVDAQFRQWRAAHPDWRVIEKADDGKFAMIEVPQIEVAGSVIGPVWFTWRADANFHDYMSSMMDRQVEGTIGGNAFSHFVMTVDYPGAAAYFRCTRACGKGKN